MKRSEETPDETGPLAVALYSDDRTVRAQVHLALGDQVADDLPPLTVTDFATAGALVAALDKTPFDCVILDAEAAPAGGMGVVYQIKDEIVHRPPTVLLVARPADIWLATWARADGVAIRPVDPLTLPGVVAGVIRAARAGTLAEVTTEPGAASRHG